MNQNMLMMHTYKLQRNKKNKSQQAEMRKIMRKWITYFQPMQPTTETRREMKNEFPK